MAGGIDWFRWHHGSVTDPKFQLVARKSKQALASVIAVWAFVLEQASASEDRGSFGTIDCEAIDCLLGLEDGATDAILAAMGERGLVDDGAVSAWEKRQPKRERTDNTSTERSRAHRDRQRQEQQEGEKQRHATPEIDDATPCNAMQHQKKPRGEESREEKNSPSLRSGEGAAKPQRPPGRKRSEARTLSTYLAECRAAKVKPVPDDHAVRRWAADAGLTPDMLQIAWLQFRDRYTEGEKGKGKRYRDWPAHFATAVKDNWFRLWFTDDKGGMCWSSNGMTHKAVLDARAAQMEAEHEPA